MVANFYNRNRRGSEYYKKKDTFIHDEDGTELYAHDELGNEFYPPNGSKLFAKNPVHQEYYARDRNGDEIYPVRNGLSVLISDEKGKPVIGKYKDGSQRYPKDKRGHEYYLNDNGKPIVLKNGQQQAYLARTRKGYPMVPWNVFNDYVEGNEPYLFFRDAMGNGVYTKESDLSPAIKCICHCLCHFIFLCPPVADLLSRFL